MRTRINIFRTASVALRSRGWGRGALSSLSTSMVQSLPANLSTTSLELARSDEAVQCSPDVGAKPAAPRREAEKSAAHVKNLPSPNPEPQIDSSLGLGEGPATSSQSPSVGTTCAAKSPSTSPRLNPLRVRVATATVAMTLVAGSLALAAAPASALSKHVFASSFTGSGPLALTNPTDVALDRSSGDVYVANAPEDNRQLLELSASGGTFTLTFKGQTTAPIAIPPFGLEEKIQEALEALPAVGAGNVQVFNNLIAGYVVVFKGSLADTEQPQMSADPSGLFGGAHSAQVSTLISGSGAADVEKFTSSGQFIYVAGKGVNKTKLEQAGSSEAEQNLCTAVSGDACQPGTPGSTPGAFDGFYSFVRTSLNPNSGNYIPEDEHHLYLAVDQDSGDLYVGDPTDGIVTKLDPQGNLESGWGKGGRLDGSTAGVGGPFQLANSTSYSQTIQGVGVRPDGTLLVERGLATEREGGFLFRFAPDGTFLSSTGTRRTQETLEASGGAIDPATHDRYSIERLHFDEVMVVTHDAPSGEVFETFGDGELSEPHGVALDPANGTVYVADSGHRRVAVFTAVPDLPDAIPSASSLTPHSEELEGEVERDGAGEITGCHFEYGETSSYESGSLPCIPASFPYSNPSTPVSAEASGLEYATTYHFRLVAENANGQNTSFDDTFTTLPQAAGLESVTGQAFAETARIDAEINPGGGQTTFRVEYVTQHAFDAENGFEHAQNTPDLSAGSERTPHKFVAHLNGLEPGTKYHYRVVVENSSSPPGGTTSAEHAFTTLPFVAEPPENCANAHVRQQTSSAQLLDCRAYELVSAAQAAGYDVESNVIPGQTPFAGYPQAEGRVLYGVHSGGIPGTNHPTNRGVDPYVAVRGDNGWSTEYVGVPANNPFSAAPFSSVPTGADATLEDFAFGGPDSCSPCFEGGYTGLPVHAPDGKLVQGMVSSGVTPPGPSAKADGLVAAPLSASGEHLIFGSTSLFAPGGNDETGDVSIYDRNLRTGETHVVSNQPGTEDFAEALPCLQGPGECHSPGDKNGIAELGVSADGSRIVLGQKVSEDSEGNAYYHLYMEINDGVRSIDLTPGAADGALFDGMNEAGTRVFFTTKDALTTSVEQDVDHSADIYMMDLSTPSTPVLSRISIGEGTGNTDECHPVANTKHEHWNTTGSIADCGVVAIGGGGGVASSGNAIYFLSPEKLAGPTNGVHDAPNLYLARPGQLPHYVTTLESSSNAPLPLSERKFVRAVPSSQLVTRFEVPTGVAVTEVPSERGDTYVFDLTNEEAKGNVRKFNATGEPITSFGTGGKITGSPSFAGIPSLGLATEIAVDNDPTSASYGDLYVVNLYEEVVEKFSANGTFEGSFYVEFPSGVAVDPSTGDVYVTETVGGVRVFDDEGNELRSFPTIPYPSGVAVSPSGIVYVVDGGGFREGILEEPGEAEAYDTFGNPIRKLEVDGANPRAFGVAVEPKTEHVFLDEGNQVVELDTSGNQLGSPTGSGRLTKSIGLAASGGELYVSNRGTGPNTGEVDVFGPAHLPPDRATDNQLVIDSVSAAATRHTADFQTNPSGDQAVFPSSLALAGNEEEPNGHLVLYRYDASAEQLTCISCTVSGFPSTGDSSLAANGLSLADDGRVFFDSREILLGSDTDEKLDVYEWEPSGVGNCNGASPTFVAGSCVALVSAGTSSFDSGLLSATSNARDVYFFTRDSLVPQDENGPTMKIYDARAEGGFPYRFPPVTCRASDECHGAASPPPPPLEVGAKSNESSYQATKGCKRGFTREHGKCVHKPRHPKHHGQTAHHHGGRR